MALRDSIPPREIRSFHLSNLPSEAEMDILSRLPIKRMFMLKLVSQQWFEDDLFKDTRFISSFSIQNRSGLWIKKYNGDLFMVEFKKSHRYQTLPCQENVMKLVTGYHIPLRYDNSNFVGCFHNFLFFFQLDSVVGCIECLVMANPLSREVVRLPFADPHSVYGVGVHERNYTVVQFTDGILYLYKIGTDVLADKYGAVSMPVTAAFLNVNHRGNLYWSVHDVDVLGVGVNALELMRLDLQTQQVYPVNGPVVDHYVYGDVAMVDGNVCAFHFGVSTFQMWSMLNGHRWEQKISIARNRIYADSDLFIPITVLFSGEVVFGPSHTHHIHSLVAYSPLMDHTRVIDLNVSGKVVGVFIPSFQPINEVIDYEEPLVTLSVAESAEIPFQLV